MAEEQVQLLNRSSLVDRLVARLQAVPSLLPSTTTRTNPSQSQWSTPLGVLLSQPSIPIPRPLAGMPLAARTAGLRLSKAVLAQLVSRFETEIKSPFEPLPALPSNLCQPRWCLRKTDA